jgi:hypothetical protein
MADDEDPILKVLRSLPLAPPDRPGLFTKLIQPGFRS